MSGHSKWATIKRAKEKTDAKRGNIFTKLGNNITIAARHGGDPTTNFRLRMAIDKARSFNAPKENIERAIKRGTGELGGNNIEEVLYGLLLPGSASAIIKCLTDNKNRTLAEVKSAMQKNGGQFVDSSSVLWQFENRGIIKIKTQNANNKKQEEMALIIIDSGALDFIIEDEEIIIYTKPEELQKVKEKIEKQGLTIDEANLEMVAKEKKEVSDEDLDKINQILGALDELDEVSDYYTNLS